MAGPALAFGVAAGCALLAALLLHFWVMRGAIPTAAVAAPTTERKP
jgi:hypothetical protein